MKKSLLIIGAILATILLATIAILTAIKLNQAGTKPVAPSAPESKPGAVSVLPNNPSASCLIAFRPAVPILTPTPTLTPTPIPSCNNTCSSDANCPTNLKCVDGNCRNLSCTSETDCTCPPPAGVTTYPSPTPKLTTELVQATPTEATLPVAGIKIPTLGGIIAGFLLISLGVALLF